MTEPVPSTLAPQVLSIVDEAVSNAHAAYADARPISEAQARAASMVLPAGSTRSVLDFDPFPFRVARAEGSTIHDVDGFAYVDLLGDYTAGLLGHNPPVVAQAIQDVIERGWSLGAVADGEHRLAELVCERFPSIEQVRFTNSGTEANLMAIQLARHTTGRDKVLVFNSGYHGGLLYFGAGGTALQAPFDYVRADYNDLESVADAIDRDGAEIACLLVEPMMGGGGCLRGEPAFLSGLRDLCDQAGILLIFDEVMTSRMSVGGGQKRLGIIPDMTTLGKYLGGGMTFGAFGASAEIMGAFDPARGGTLTHGGTFNNNAFTMSVGAVAIEKLVTEEALEALFERGERLRARLAELATGYPVTVSGWGSLIGIHATARTISRPADLASVDARLSELLFHELLTRGFYLARRGFVALSLAVTDEQVSAFGDAFGQVLQDLSERSVLGEPS